MDPDQIFELSVQADKKMNTGDLYGALEIAYRIKNLGPHYYVSYVVSGLLINIGNAQANEKITREGLELLEKDFETIIRHRNLVPYAYYNRANGYDALSHFRRMRDPYATCFEKTELDEAKSHYRKALEYEPKNVEFLVNLGNCFDEIGRVIDALECYDEALKCKPDHGMALGNKGQALFYYAIVTGEHEKTFLLEAYSLLSKALKSEVTFESVSSFSKYLERIREHFPDKNILDNPPEFPGYKIEARSRFEKFLAEFCVRNRLYLNICNYCQKCDAAIGDTAVIRRMTMSRKEGEKYPFAVMNLLSYLNQIKQDYVLARFLLVLSRYSELNLDFVDKRVRIVDTFDHSLHNIRIQLAKASFKNFYDILDKIACFVNDYLGLGIPEKETYFHTLWYPRNMKTVRGRIKQTNNFSLNALFDINKDFGKKGHYEELRRTRNALTHRFVNIRSFQEKEDEQNMTEETLITQTLDLGKLVRNAIIYLLYFVDAEERKRISGR
jgi:tetratricopeptide (TPR) repeat protein